MRSAPTPGRQSSAVRGASGTSGDSVVDTVSILPRRARRACLRAGRRWLKLRVQAQRRVERRPAPCRTAARHVHDAHVVLGVGQRPAVEDEQRLPHRSCLRPRSARPRLFLTALRVRATPQARAASGNGIRLPLHDREVAEIVERIGRGRIESSARSYQDRASSSLPCAFQQCAQCVCGFG